MRKLEGLKHTEIKDNILKVLQRGLF